MQQGTESAERDAYTRHVAAEILEQLGGAHALRLMLGARFSAFRAQGAEGLQVEVASDLVSAHGDASAVRAFRVGLTPADTYNVEFFGRDADGERVLLSSVEDVYCDQLSDVIEDRTGYVLAPPPLRIVGELHL